MIRHHAVMDAPRPVGIDAGGVGRGLDQRAHQVGVVVVVLALQHRADPLQPHAGVDGRARQRLAPVGVDLLVLHEHEVPDLDEAVAVLVRAARRAACDGGAVVVEYLRTRAAGAGGAHRPEVVAGGDADDAAVGKARHLAPEVGRLVVVVIDGDQQLVLRQAEVLGQQLPRQRDGAFLEIVAEREIAQHLEERMVARGVADIVEVVVLAAGADAFLRCHGAHIVALLDAGEHVLELNHAGVGEQQRRVVARHQRRRRHDRVAVAMKVVEKTRPDVVQRCHARAPCPCPGFRPAQRHARGRHEGLPAPARAGNAA